ncbi:MAG: hypothetical protein BV459_03230 [Thermoplasmata archaeon M11B2D]|nr:MAG: hypothetical protein BV459_03230 [Thermoplasmata archaeon M11B2D]
MKSLSQVIDINKKILTDMFDLTEELDFIVGLDSVEHVVEQYELDEVSGAAQRTSTDPARLAGYQPWQGISGDTEEERRSSAESAWLQAHEKALEAEKTYSRLLKAVSPNNTKILVDFKSLDSFIDKAVNRGKDPKQIHDVLRGAILVPEKHDVLDVVKRLKKRAVVQSYEYKDEKADPEYGYRGSHHFKIVVGDIIAEVQVMTKKLWAWKEEAHKIYTKYRSLKDYDADIKKRDLEYSKKIFNLANASKNRNKNKNIKDLRRGAGKFNKAKTTIMYR